MLGQVFYVRCFARVAVAFLGLSAMPLQTLAADAGKGEIIAKRWCAACHLVSPEQTQASPDVPSFSAIARQKKPPEKLAAFLTDPHPKMPDMNLTRSEIADIVAYIRSLD
jgi:mono/diheme cytochrome c family protein